MFKIRVSHFLFVLMLLPGVVLSANSGSPFSIERFNQEVSTESYYIVAIFFSIFNFIVFTYLVTALFRVFTGSLDKESGMKNGLRLFLLAMLLDGIGFISYSLIKGF